MAVRPVTVPRRGVGRSIAVGGLTVLAGVAVGVLSATDSDLAIPVALVILVIGVASVDLALVPVLVVPATLVMARVGGALSVADLVLAVGAVVALLMLRDRGAQALQPLLWAGTFYLALTIPGLIVNPYVENTVEWLHEVALVLGSMIVGFVIGREGRARLALTLYLVLCSLIGVVSIYTSLRGYADMGQFSPVFLGDLHKNTIGGMLMVAAVIAFARPVWIGWSRPFAYAALALCGFGMLAAQSRQGLVGAVVGVIIISLRPYTQAGGRSRLIWLAAIPVGVYVISEVSSQLAEGDQSNSSYQRLTWYEEAIEIWQTSPIFGVGHRWWTTDRFENGFHPPNAEIEVLTTTGIIGLIGFLGMFAAAAWLLMKMDPMYGTVGLAVVAARFTQAQVDLYWVAGQASMLWIVAGICYGVQALDRARGTVREPGGSLLPLPVPHRAGART